MVSQELKVYGYPAFLYITFFMDLGNRGSSMLQSVAFRVHGTVDLLEKTQEISDDLGRNARELVSLRILEITNQKEGSAAPVSTASSSKIDLEPLERCEDVLKQILIETSASNLKTPGPDLLKWNLKPFIVQKQASKTKCFLRLLKDAILTGSHPLDESIKEKSDLFPVDQDGHEIPIDGGNHFIRRTFEGSNKNVQYGVALGSLDSSNLNGSTFSHRNVPLDSLLQDERAISYSSKDYAQKLCDDDSMRESGCESAKNLKITTECMDKVEKNIQKNVPNVGEVEDDMEGVLGFNSTSGIMEATKQNVPTNAGECEDFTVFSDVGYDEGRTDSMMQKDSFLCSQYACSLDSLGTAEWGEQNLCVKCCKDGKLLVCKGNACPFVVHESCLGSAASFDSEGKFYCPSCSYSQAIKQYEEAKKNSLLARKDLSTFNCFRSRRQSNKQPLIRNEMELDERLGKASEIVNGDTMKGIENHQNKRKLEEFIGQSALNCGNNLPGQGKPVESTIVTLLTTDKNNQDGQIKGKVCESLVDPGQQQMTSFVQFDCLGENSSLQVSERGTSKTGSTGAEEMSDEENESSDASKYIIKYRGVKSSYSSSSAHLLRRMRVPWTSAEEGILKEGVQIHFTPRNTNIPWKKILEHGSGTFHKNRTTMDLRSKWRNINKACPKSL